MRKKHVDDNRIDVDVGSNDKQFQCEICERYFLTLPTLRAHKQILHERAPLKCDICDFTSKHVTSMNRHKLSHLGLRHEEKQYQCENCDYATNFKDQMARHRGARHGEKKKRTCEKCSASFNNDTSYFIHKRKHGADYKPPKCPECDFVVKNVNSLTNHLRTHRAEKPFVCDHPLCDHAYKSKGHLKRHKLTHLENYAVECKICHERLRSDYLLKKHVKKLHA